MTARWPSTCECCDSDSKDLCGLDLDGVGGDTGFCQDYPVASSDRGITLSFDFDPANQPARLVVIKNPTADCIPGDHAANIAAGTVVFDTGCVSQTNNPYDYVIENDVDDLRIVVIPNCHDPAATGTAWSLTTQCSNLQCLETSTNFGIVNTTDDPINASDTGIQIGNSPAFEGVVWAFLIDASGFDNLDLAVRVRSGSYTGVVIAETTISAFAVSVLIWEPLADFDAYVTVDESYTVEANSSGQYDLAVRCATPAEIADPDGELF